MSLAPEDEGSAQAPAGLSAAHVRLLNTVAAVAFTIGGSLFALGAALAELGSADPTASACIYFAGGLFFNTGGYATVLQVINPPGSGTGWRWWAWEPERVEWVSAARAVRGHARVRRQPARLVPPGPHRKQENRLIWAPDMVGCTLFLVSGHLALAQICRRRICWKPRRLDWWIAALNQVGSYLFLISALAAFVNPETSSAVNEAVANWGTFAGALCFAIGGVLQGIGGMHHPETHASAIAGLTLSARRLMARSTMERGIPLAVEDMAGHDLEDMGPVDYVLIEFPDGVHKGEAAPLLLDLVDRGVIRILDLMFISKAEDGSTSALEIADIDGDGEAGLRRLRGRILGAPRPTRTETRPGNAMEPGTAALLIVFENRWAAPFAKAMREAGGQLVAFGRIPVQALLASLEAAEAKS